METDEIALNSFKYKDFNVIYKSEVKPKGTSFKRGKAFLDEVSKAIIFIQDAKSKGRNRVVYRFGGLLVTMKKDKTFRITLTLNEKEVMSEKSIKNVNDKLSDAFLKTQKFIEKMNENK